MTKFWTFCFCTIFFAFNGMGQDTPVGAPANVDSIKGQFAFFEAEDFFEQTNDKVRKWIVTKKSQIPDIKPDADPSHLDAETPAYIEVLPDTRTNHDEKLIHGENFAPEPGKMAILKYKVTFPKAGRYYVWARAYSTGSEDNGFHFGLNGEWPESGQRWQTVVKNRWHWECKQRTDKVHTGVKMQLFLDIPSAGEHEISVSMREDGAELDKVLLVMDKNYRPPGAEGKDSESNSNAPDKPAVTAPKIERKADGEGSVKISGELKQWHKVTLTLNGLWAHERDEKINPFTDCSLVVDFRHQSGAQLRVPGYFAADGNAGETSAKSGTQWRAHLSPFMPGRWTYTTYFVQAKDAAFDDFRTIATGVNAGAKGSFEVAESDKSAPDFRASNRGFLEYTGARYLQFAGDGGFFLKAGPDAPETLLGYRDFDGTRANNPGKCPLKSFEPHVRDWKEGDPVWKDGKGKGMIGALNYLSGKGLNSFSFLTYNAGGDGDNVWPFVERDLKFHYDCSKLDQWGVVFDHGTAHGLHLHFKLQETENDDNRGKKNSKVPTSLDGGALGRERKLYLRELIARFGHNLALNWNIGEENTQSTEEVQAMAEYIAEIDSYDHPIVIHTYPNQQEKVYRALLGNKSEISGASLQNGWDQVHRLTLQWVNESADSGKNWVVANDEQGPADLGVPPDPGYKGFSGKAEKGGKSYDLHDIRRNTLWGNLMAGGAGVEYYFGYKLPENDLKMEDYRSRDQSWDFCRIALEFFQKNEVPFSEMKNADEMVGNPKNENGKPWCLAKAGEAYVVFLPEGAKSAKLDLIGVTGDFEASWHDISKSSAAAGDPVKIAGGNVHDLGKNGNTGDVAIYIRKK